MSARICHAPDAAETQLVTNADIKRLNRELLWLKQMIGFIHHGYRLERVSWKSPEKVSRQTQRRPSCEF